MPSKLSAFKWGPRDTSWDQFIRNLVAQRGYGVERTYFGITDRARAEEVRKGLKNAGRAMGHSVKSFWSECTGCEHGGATCRYHVNFTAYDPEVAKSYMQRKSQYAGDEMEQ